MRTMIYKQQDGKDLKITYDENAPCIVCGEPVISASMGGTVICPSCDLGKCRYCGMTVFVMKKEIDGGESKKKLLDHIKWHKENNPELVKKVNDGHRKFNEAFDKMIENKEKITPAAQNK